VQKGYDISKKNDWESHLYIIGGKNRFPFHQKLAKEGGGAPEDTRAMFGKEQKEKKEKGAPP